MAIISATRAFAAATPRACEDELFRNSTVDNVESPIATATINTIIINVTTSAKPRDLPPRFRIVRFIR